MKLVTDFSSPVDAEIASHSLEAKGIATFVSSKRSALFPMSRGGASAAGLWVVLDDQLRDAQNLLINPDHEVTFKLSQAELEEIKSSIDSNDMSGAVNILFRLLGVVAAFALVVYFVTNS